MNSNIKIILVDDEVLFRKGIVFILQREKNIEIIFEASNGEELIDFLKDNKENHPDMILMDLKMPLLNGIEATKIINKEYSNIKIIALSSYDSKSFISNMLQVGAVSYLVKNATPIEMVKTINEVSLKGFHYNETVLQNINDELLIDKKLKSNFDDEYLTSREKEVLRLICQQFSTSQIAEKLFISPRTVDGHRNNLMLKTESKNVAGLLVFALQNKIIDLNEFEFDKGI